MSIDIMKTNDPIMISWINLQSNAFGCHVIGIHFYYNDEKKNDLMTDLIWTQDDQNDMTNTSLSLRNLLMPNYWPDFSCPWIIRWVIQIYNNPLNNSEIQKEENRQKSIFCVTSASKEIFSFISLSTNFLL